MWLHCLNDTTLAFFNYYSAFDATRTQRFTSLPVGSVHRHTSHAPAPAPRARTRTRRGRGRGGTKSKDTEHLPLRSSLSGGGLKCQSRLRLWDLLRRRHTETIWRSGGPVKKNKKKRKNKTKWEKKTAGASLASGPPPPLSRS